ncbi:MAG: stage III sporulation protein AC [Clostridiales bacterium]|nr:stage III sporulation protein AC [Clostridiales bacterium]
MQVDLIFKVAAVGIIVAVLNQLLTHSGRAEQAMMTTLAGLIVVLMILLQQINQLFTYIKNIFGF